MINIDDNSHPFTLPIKHGGNLEAAIQKYGSPQEEWIDLSTGISPWSWPVKDLPSNVWRNLPPPPDELIAVACEYYRVNKDQIMVTPGSQIAIRLLPHLFEPSTIAIPSLGYQEHASSWHLAKHTIVQYQNATELLELINSKQVKHAVVINPNNPSGECLDSQAIEQIASQLSGSIIIDEAFIDLFDNAEVRLSPNNLNITSAVSNLSSNMIILRSVGKFFGLAGLRLGFAIGNHPKLSILNGLLQPWPISHASLAIGIEALADKQWQQAQRERIQTQTNLFLPLLNQFINTQLNNVDHNSYHIKSCSLFNTLFIDGNQAHKILEKIHETLALNGIWTRLYNQGDNPPWLRFSLPEELSKLEKRLKAIAFKNKKNSI